MTTPRIDIYRVSHRERRQAGPSGHADPGQLSTGATVLDPDRRARPLRTPLGARRFAAEWHGLLLWLVVGILAPAASYAREMPSLPIGIALGKSPLGSWSEYVVTAPGRPAEKYRFLMRAIGCADVQPQAPDIKECDESDHGTVTTVTIELTVTKPSGNSTTIALRTSRDTSERQIASGLAVMVCNNAPMDLPLNGFDKKQFTFIDPSFERIREQVKVPAGTFSTKVARFKPTPDASATVWLNEHVPPLGFVRLETIGPGNAEQTTYELIAFGFHGVPQITGSPMPFDAAQLLSQAAKCQ